MVAQSILRQPALIDSAFAVEVHLIIQLRQRLINWEFNCAANVIAQCLLNDTFISFSIFFVFKLFFFSCIKTYFSFAKILPFIYNLQILLCKFGKSTRKKIKIVF